MLGPYLIDMAHFLWLTALPMKKVVQWINPNQDLYFELDPPHRSVLLGHRTLTSPSLCPIQQPEPTQPPSILYAASLHLDDYMGSKLKKTRLANLKTYHSQQRMSTCSVADPSCVPNGTKIRVEFHYILDPLFPASGLLSNIRRCLRHFCSFEVFQLKVGAITTSVVVPLCPGKGQRYNLSFARDSIHGRRSTVSFWEWFMAFFVKVLKERENGFLCPSPFWGLFVLRRWLFGDRTQSPVVKDCIVGPTGVHETRGFVILGKRPLVGIDALAFFLAD